MIKAGDMFCGFGGWSTGAARTGGIDLRVAVNHCAVAVEHHERAHPGALHLQQDCAEVDWFSLVPELRGGLLIASPACQGFSEAGQPARKGTGGNGKVNVAGLMSAHKGKRNTAHAVTCAADVIRPRVLLIENVTRMMDWELFPWWLDGFRAMGYEVRVHVLNASRYGGAQDRERVIITGSLDGAIDLQEDYGRGLAGGTRLADCLDLDAAAGADLGDKVYRWRAVDSCPTRTRELIRRKQEQYGAASGILNNVSESRLRPFDDLAPTLTTKSGEQLMHIDGDRVRIVNPNELARMMGWTLDEAAHLPKNRGKASTLIGNAVPVDLAQGVCEQVLATLN